MAAFYAPSFRNRMYTPPPPAQHLTISTSTGPLRSCKTCAPRYKTHLHPASPTHTAPTHLYTHSPVNMTGRPSFAAATASKAAAKAGESLTLSAAHRDATHAPGPGGHCAAASPFATGADPVPVPAPGPCSGCGPSEAAGVEAGEEEEEAGHWWQ